MKHRAKVALGCGITGVLLIAIINDEWQRSTDLWPYAFVGAALAGVGFSRFFGGQGRHGGLMAGLGSVLATLVGSFVAGLPLTFGFVINGMPEMLLFPPVFVIGGLMTEPLGLVVWFLGMGATHLATRHGQTFPSG